MPRARMSGVACFAVVYIVGLVAIVIAGMLSPTVWVAKQAVFAVPTDGVASSASQDYVFPMSGYKVCSTNQWGQARHQTVQYSTQRDGPVHYSQQSA